MVIITPVTPDDDHVRVVGGTYYFLQFTSQFFFLNIVRFRMGCLSANTLMLFLQQDSRQFFIWLKVRVNHVLSLVGKFVIPAASIDCSFQYFFDFGFCVVKIGYMFSLFQWWCCLLTRQVVNCVLLEFVMGIKDFKKWIWHTINIPMVVVSQTGPYFCVKASIVHHVSFVRRVFVFHGSFYYSW